MPLFGKDKETKEIEREVKYRQGLSKVRAYVEKSRESQRRLWGLGKRALKLGDQQNFQNIARAYVRVGGIISRWEKYLVAVETVAVQRGQVKATGDFLKSMQALSESMMSGAKPQEITKMQVDLEKALVKAQTIDETLAAVMDASSDTIFSSEGLSDESLKEVQEAMSAEAAHDESSTVQDERIASGIKSIEEQMRKEMK